jgi:hypothetical protein
VNDDFGLDELNEGVDLREKFQPISYENEMKKRASVAQQAAVEKENRAVFNQLCDYWNLNGTDANLNVIREFCNGQITVEKFQVMLETPGERESLDWTGTHERIISEISDLLYDPTGRRMNDFDLKQTVAKMKYWEKSKLRARLAELKFKQGKSAQEARNLLADHRKVERNENPYHPYDRMPDSLTPQAIRRGTTEQLIYWGQRFGQAQVKARLNQK